MERSTEVTAAKPKEDEYFSVLSVPSSVNSVSRIEIQKVRLE